MLAPGKSCTAQGTFIPTVIQAYTGTVTFQPQVSGCGGGTRNYPAQTIAVTGTGIAQPSAVGVSPAVLDFGQQVVGTISDPVTVTLTNLSETDSIAIEEFQLDG